MKAHKNLEATGQACISLTPMIKDAIGSMQAGEVLKVYNDDAASREGVPAWCRLTGNTLLETEEIDETQTHFYIQKKES
jgi:TusA-related sulfurtransferase